MSETVELQVLLVLRELPNGDVVAYPAGEPSWVAYGHDDDDVVQQLTLFLSEKLASVGGDKLGPLEYPDASELVEVDVELAFPELPRRLRRSVTLRLPCLITPEDGGRWVEVLVTRQVIHVLAEQDWEGACATSSRA